MSAPSSAVRVRVDARGRLVLPRGLREDVVTAPGEVLLRRTPDGLLVTPAEIDGAIRYGKDGLPVLTIGGPVSNDEVLHAIEAERADQ